MAKYLKSIELYFDKSLQIDISTGIFSVIDMYCFYLQKEKVEFDGVTKIVIIVSKKEDIFIMDGVAKVDIVNNIDFTFLCKLPTSEAREKLISVLIELIITRLNCSIYKNLKLHCVLNILKNKKFLFTDTWSKSKWDLEKNTQAKIEWCYSNKIDIFFLLKDRRGNEIEKWHISSLNPSLGVLDYCLGDIKWDKNIILLFHSNKKDYWSLDVNTKNIYFYFERAEKEDAHGQYDLGIMYLHGNSFLIRDEKKAYFWLNKAVANGYTKALKHLSSTYK